MPPICWQSTYNWPPLCCGRTAPEVSEEEGCYASCFYRFYAFLAWRSLLWLSMPWRRKHLTQSNFISTKSLAWSLALHLLFCFSQEKPLRWKEVLIYTHTRTHTHTHTHTHTQTHTHNKQTLVVLGLLVHMFTQSIKFYTFHYYTY